MFNESNLNKFKAHIALIHYSVLYLEQIATILLFKAAFGKYQHAKSDYLLNI